MDFDRRTNDLASERIVVLHVHQQTAETQSKLERVFRKSLRLCVSAVFLPTFLRGSLVLPLDVAFELHNFVDAAGVAAALERRGQPDFDHAVDQAFAEHVG